MAEERNVGLERATDTSADADTTKAELQRRMEEARESITQTVTEIKDTVVNQYQQVRENISDTLDWREQYRRHTLPFTLTAFAVGTFVGYTVAGAFKGGGGDGDEDFDADESFAAIDAGFDRGLRDAGAGSGQRSYAAQPVLGGAYQRASRPETNASTESAEVFGRGEHKEDVGPETRPSYSSGYQASSAPPPPQAQGLASYASSSHASGAAEEPEEPKGPGLIERFKETKAYDRLQDELSTLGERALEELSRTARTVVVPALLAKVKNMIGLDLSGQQQQGGGAGRPAAAGSQPSQSAYSAGGGAGAAAGSQGGGGATSDPAGTTARAAAGGTEGYGAS
ncbi:MAG TPA: hypothetical protein VF668_03810 [Pyrinomonadaceae bacterium]|jgi:hypothetical protein